MSSKLEPVILPCATGQQIRCFDRCKLTITLISNIKVVHCKPNLHVSANLLHCSWSKAAMLCDSSGIIIIMRMCPRVV